MLSARSTLPTRDDASLLREALSDLSAKWNRRATAVAQRSFRWPNGDPATEAQVSSVFAMRDRVAAFAGAYFPPHGDSHGTSPQGQHAAAG